MNQVKLRSYEKIEEENKELKTVMRKLSHEMGNALTLLGASIYYLENQIAGGCSKFDIKDLKGDYSYICNLFKNLKEYNHAEALDKREITITDIIKDIENSFARLSGSEQVTFTTHRLTDTDKVKVYADMTKMRQVIINIIKNSIEAMEDNLGERNIVVRVGTEMVADDRIDNTLQRVAGKEIVHIEIRDNGKGISEQYVGEIFQPMFTYGKKDGTGLGLSVVKKIVEDHQGKIKAVSVQGTGTAIHIYLPVLNKIKKNQTTCPTCGVS